MKGSVKGRFLRFSPAGLLRSGVCLSLLLSVQAGYAQQSVEPLKPLPLNAQAQLNPVKVKLGEKLFFDTRFSKDNTLSCASCHLPEHGGADPRPRSAGMGGAMGEVNTPSTFNAAHNFRQFWDGRAATLEEQIGFVVENPVELASSWPEVLKKLKGDKALVDEVAKIYPEGITVASITDAIAAYERSLPGDSRFDLYLRGDKSAITAEEREGYEKFKSYGCVACHQGVNVGGNMYQVFGVMGDYFKDRGNVTKADLGRFNVTGRESDKHMFKVPSLRNVALTPPYFHDGSAARLEDAVDVMFKYQLGRPAPARDKELIIKFLHTLTAQKYVKAEKAK